MRRDHQKQSCLCCRLASLTRAGAGLGRLAAASAAVVHLALDLRVRADILQSGGVAIVAVDTGELATVLSGDTLDVDVALALARTVSAGTVELAVVLYIEVYDVDGSAAVMLNDFVGSVVRTA